MDKNLQSKTLHKSMFYPGLVEQRSLESNTYITKHGLEIDRPTGTTHYRQYFATDTNKLYIYNGTTWVSVTLS